METIQIKPLWFNSFLGFIMPFFVKYFISKNYSREVKTLIALLIGIFSVYLQGKLFLNTKNLDSVLFEIFTISQISYNLFWKEYFKNS